MEASSQIRLFMLIMFTGAALGAIFDVYRVLWGIFRPNVFFTSLLDLLYWLLATFFVFSLLLFANWGEVRFYVFIALLTGAVLYYRYASRYMMHIFIGILRAGRKILKYLQIMIQCIVRPFRYIALLLFQPFVSIAQKCKQYYRQHRSKP